MPSSTGTQTWRGQKYWTDSGDLARGGTIKDIGPCRITLFDRRTGKFHQVPVERATPMTTRQMEAYYAVRTDDDIHPQELLKRRLEVVATWGPADRAARKVR